MATIDLGRVVGSQGPQGERGPAGPTGAQGPAGAQGPKGEPGAGAGENLLDNWYFADPVNQRGKTTYHSTDGTTSYTIDRWRFGGYTGARITLVSGAGITFHAGNKWLLQKKEVPGLSGRTVTGSVLLGDGRLFTGTVALTETYQSFATFNDDTSGAANRFQVQYSGGVLDMRIVSGGTSASTPQFSVVAVKLELGSHQTLARQDAGGSWVLNDPPPDKAIELAKCQRYYQRYEKNGFCVVAYLHNESAYLFIPTPVTMRANPAVTISGQFDTYTSAGESVETYMTYSGSGKLSDNGVTVMSVPVGDEFQTAVSLFAPYDGGLIELSTEL